MKFVIHQFFPLSFFLCCVNAHAAIVMYSFTGTAGINDNTSSVGGNSAAQEPVSGTFYYDPEATLTSQNTFDPPDVGTITSYSTTNSSIISHFTLSFRSYTIQADTTHPLSLNLQNLLASNPGNRSDSFSLRSAYPTSADVIISPTDYNDFSITFLDYTGNFITTNELPTSLNLNAPVSGHLTLQIRDPQNPGTVLWQVLGQMDQLTVIPEPSSCLLFVFGSIGLLARRRKC